MAVTDDHPVRLTGPESHRLADMAGVQWDLRYAAATAAQLSRRRKAKAPDMHVLEAMQDSAIIRYGRCFKDGVRIAFRIPQEWINDLPVDLRQEHDELILLRDRHIAHSVNDWEINTPVARVRVDRETGEMTVHAVTVNQSRVLMLATESLDRLWRLAKALADRVQQEMQQEQARLLEHAKSIPVEELKRRIVEDRADFPGQQNVGKRRAR